MLVVWIASVGNDGRFIAVAVAQFGVAFSPRRILVVRHAPSCSEVLPGIVVFPVRPFLDPLHSGHLGPTDEFMAGFGLCSQCKRHVREVRPGPRGAGDQEVVQPHPARFEGQVAGVELHGRVEVEFRSEVIEHERRAFAGKRAQIFDLLLPKFHGLNAVAVRRRSARPPLDMVRYFRSDVARPFVDDGGDPRRVKGRVQMVGEALDKLLGVGRVLERVPDPRAGVVVVVVVELSEVGDVVVGGTAEAAVEVGENEPPLAARLGFPQDDVVAPAAVARPDFR